MKLVTFESNGTEQAGVVEGSQVFGLNSPMREIVAGGLDAARIQASIALSGNGLPLSSVTLRAPLTPSTIRDFVAFEDHVDGVVRSIQGTSGVPEAWYEAPRFYFANPYTVTGHDTLVSPPAGCNALDFELEIAAVVGKSGSNVPVSEADSHIFGYTILNDWSARDLQRREMEVGLGPAKGKDFANSLGPWIVTADEFDRFRTAEGYFDVECSVSVNGEVVGGDSLRSMAWTFEALLAYASRDSWVHPGDVLGSGTVGKGGCLAELWGRHGEQSPPPLREGDIVELAVEGIGVLRNTVGVARPVPEIPTARRGTYAAGQD